MRVWDLTSICEQASWCWNSIHYLIWLWKWMQEFWNSISEITLFCSMCAVDFKLMWTMHVDSRTSQMLNYCKMHIRYTAILVKIEEWWSGVDCCCIHWQWGCVSCLCCCALFLRIASEQLQIGKFSFFRPSLKNENFSPIWQRSVEIWHRANQIGPKILIF